MRKRLIISSAIFSLSAFALLLAGWGFYAAEKASSAGIAIDKRKEADFKEASENRGCAAIPYSDLKAKCSDISREVTTYCKTIPMKCVAFRAELDRMKKAGNKKRIEEIRTECLLRRSIAHNCVTARANGMAIFSRAESKIEAEKAVFQKALDDLQDELSSKTRKRSTSMIEAEISYCKKMIGYSDVILAHYSAEYDEHKRILNRYKEVVDDCDKFNHNFD